MDEEGMSYSLGALAVGGAGRHPAALADSMSKWRLLR
jgi:hypothetical protein